jgi:DNA repair photolyase
MSLLREVMCKSALSASALSDSDLSLNPYVGCGHGCYYCYAPYVTHRDPGEWTNARAKINITEILQKELKSGKAYHRKVALSTVTDPYQSLEREYKLTRKCLIELLNYNAYPSVQTKSSLVLRDIDIIRRFEEREVGFTLTSLNPFYEPYADPAEKRIEALKILKREGIRTFVFIGPVMPHYTTEELIEELRKVEPDYVVVDRLRIKKGMEEGIRKIYSSLELEKRSLEIEAEEVRRLCLSYGLNLVEQHLWKDQP